MLLVIDVVLVSIPVTDPGGPPDPDLCTDPVIVIDLGGLSDHVPDPISVTDLG